MNLDDVEDQKAELNRLVLKFFDGNEAKTRLWFSSENPLLGNVSPDDMIRWGRSDRLLMFVKQQLADNEREEC